MADNIRDRILALRILSPQLLKTLRQKISKVEEIVTAKAEAEQKKQKTSVYRSKHSHLLLPQISGTTNPIAKDGHITDLEGVQCIPTKDGSTLWSFICDDKKYPARLVNLPCPVEVHKTFDHNVYYKCSDVGQMLIVYENLSSLEEAEGMKDYKVEEFQSYFHSGLTPPMKRVVQRRFKAREHKNEPYRRSEVVEVMTHLRDLILQIRPDTSKNKSKSKGSNANSSSDASKVIEVIEDVEVPYEPWMTNDGKTPEGIQFDETDALCYKHPELWLHPSETVFFEEQERKKSKKKKNRTTVSVMEVGNVGDMVNDPTFSMGSTATHKKGIASKKNREKLDEVTQAAISMKNTNGEDNFEDLFGGVGDTDGFDFDGDDILNFDA